ERFGGIDILVNLACSYVDDGLASPRADWLESLNVNVVSAVMMTRAVRPHMLARGGGAIVNFTSISSRVAQTGRWLYPVGKASFVTGADWAVDGGYSAMGPEQAEPAIPKLQE